LAQRPARATFDSGHKLPVAGIAALAFVSIAGLAAVASYIDNYYAESVGQWVAHDLRVRTYHHLQRLSLGYYSSHKIGTILSTMTADIQTIQGFASSSTLGILVDLLTIFCMLALMFWLNWDFTLIALAVTLDSESEKLVIDALERLMKGRTVIMIAHRLITIRDADQIIVISGGKVAESGTHDELMALDRIYAELHRTQFETTSEKAESATPESALNAAGGS